MSTVDDALTIFNQGYNCAQAVLMACGPELGMERETCTRVAAAFGAGIARTGETCGAVTGALMVLGLQHWDITRTDAEAKAALYQRAQEFLAQFTKQHHSVLCRDLLGCDLSTPEGAALARERDFHHTLCPRFVQAAVELLAELK